MNSRRFNELSRPGDVDGLLATTALSGNRSLFAAGGENEFNLEGGQNEFAFNTRGAVHARRKKSDMILLAQNLLEEDDLFNFNTGLYPWGRARRYHADADGKRRADADGRRAPHEDADRARVATDEDGRRIVVDKEGRVAVDAEGRAVVIDGDNYRVADGGDGLRVVINAEGRVLTGPDGKAITVDDATDFRIVSNADGARSLVGPDRAPLLSMNLQEPDVRVANGTDIGTYRIGREVELAAAAADPARVTAPEAPRVTSPELTVPRAAVVAEAAPRVVAAVDPSVRVVAPEPIDAVRVDDAPRAAAPVETARVVAPEAPETLRPVQIDDAAPRVAVEVDPVRVAPAPEALAPVRAGDAPRSPAPVETARVVAPEAPETLRPVEIDDAAPRVAVEADPVRVAPAPEALDPVRIDGAPRAPAPIETARVVAPEVPETLRPVDVNDAAPRVAVETDTVRTVAAPEPLTAVPAEDAPRVAAPVEPTRIVAPEAPEALRPVAVDDVAPRVAAEADPVRVTTPPASLPADIAVADTVRVPVAPEIDAIRVAPVAPDLAAPVVVAEAPRPAPVADAPVRMANTPVELPRVLDTDTPIRIPEEARIVVADAPAAPRAPAVDAPSVVLSPVAPDVDVRMGSTPVELPRVLDAGEPIRLPAMDVAPPAPPVDTRALETERFRTFLAGSGETLEDFQNRVQNAVNGPEVPHGADIEIPGRALNIDTIRGGRLLRMATPNGFDLFLAGGVGTGVAIYSGMQAGVIDRATGGSNVSALAAAAYEGSGAGLKAGAETLPLVGTGIAAAEGRTAEATVRGIEDAVEIVSPFAFAVIGAGGGAAAGSAAGGVGAVPGAAIGFIGGVAAGIVVSLTASEATRAIARGLGYDDVDRGMIGAWFAPEYAEEMEGWISSMTRDGRGWREGESLSDVMERINEGATTSHERTERFREFLDRINQGIYEQQTAQVEAVSERIARDTGLEDVTAALRFPETRARITEFYQQQAAENPADEEAQRILETLQAYEQTEAERIKLVTARTGADLMDAREITDELQDNLSGGLGERLMTMEIMYNTSSYGFGVAQRDPALDAVQSDLASIDYQARLADIRARLIESEDMPARDVITNALANGRDAYAETGVTQLMAESYNLLMEAEETLVGAQNRIVDENYESIRMHIDPQALITRGWFRSDTTLGAELEQRLRDAEPNDPEAQELRDLLSETNNLSNLSPETVRRLMNNQIFLREFQRVESYRDDGVLREELHNSGFFFRHQAIDDVRRQLRDLNATGNTYGFGLTVTTPGGRTVTPGPRQPAGTERDPNAPEFIMP